ncbi:orotidine 5'-phosphate decarboxylase / HUMPS family protein [Mesorhizobium sp.]|uniref:orotidine 5'-phosphate decarboxylase / HUMPS family protein n=1 Tax=Mesorhizobium sp. TaxID=1871066 RepID=UPI000FE98854|nr:orotidine 5'-phosphate decarboxylase / HUMPS family protein [Mesorhizobium sp.]RWK53640.1 MAG: hypothetical protein EOR48_21275 [Mesorhizobium sp.]TIP47524.1 MAG: hypothetical protein E5X62_05450 [Mesorhizobium sp.]
MSRQRTTSHRIAVGVGADLARTSCLRQDHLRCRVRFALPMQTCLEVAGLWQISTTKHTTAGWPLPCHPRCPKQSERAALLLQVAFDKPEHLALLAQMKEFADIIEIGTPLLKRLGLSAITTARELCPEVMVLADTKTVDGGRFEADMVFGAGAAFMTVLSCASSATHEAVGKRAAAFGATVIVDTITEAGKAELLPLNAVFPESFGYVAVHSPTDARLAGNISTSHIDAVRKMHDRGFLVSLAGGIGPDTLEAVIAVEPEILVVGSAITESASPKEVARWIRDRLPNPGRGWPSDRR